MVNTERPLLAIGGSANYNILNIVVNTEHKYRAYNITKDYNILNIVVNTELGGMNNVLPAEL